MKTAHRWQGRNRRRQEPRARAGTLGLSVWEWCETPKDCRRHTAHRGWLVRTEDDEVVVFP